ncbi:MAG: nicotinate (nicotinamide) nucleotide adenylyltransferase [Planctomycetales bacterium]|nr:nicotinate (nicotinamide) nucleotide adenylyltransferase [Planctomycetales bacterium]
MSKFNDFSEGIVMDNRQKIILFGGSFDPIHTGHLRVAQHTQQALDAQQLIFIPARRSPHKRRLEADGVHRLAMIRLAIVGLAGIGVSDCELCRPEPSYTLDTVRIFRRQVGPEAVLFWLIGADQLEDFDKWYRVSELLENCRVCVMMRAGYPRPDIRRFSGVFSDAQIARLEKDAIHTPEIPLSSTDIRRQLACGHVLPEALPPAVAAYIKEHRLYGFDARLTFL